MTAETTHTGHWCEWCRDHDDRYDAGQNALTDFHMVTTTSDHALVYVSAGGLMHLHNVTIMPLGEETLARTAGRVAGGRLRRLVWRVNGSPNSWTGRNAASGRARRVGAAALYRLAARLDQVAIPPGQDA